VTDAERKGWRLLASLLRKELQMSLAKGRAKNMGLLSMHKYP